MFFLKLKIEPIYLCEKENYDKAVIESFYCQIVFISVQTAGQALVRICCGFDRLLHGF